MTTKNDIQQRIDSTKLIPNTMFDECVDARPTEGMDDRMRCCALSPEGGYEYHHVEFYDPKRDREYKCRVVFTASGATVYGGFDLIKVKTPSMPSASKRGCKKYDWECDRDTKEAWKKKAVKTALHKAVAAWKKDVVKELVEYQKHVSPWADDEVHRYKIAADNPLMLGGDIETVEGTYKDAKAEADRMYRRIANRDNTDVVRVVISTGGVSHGY